MATTIIEVEAPDQLPSPPAPEQLDGVYVYSADHVERSINQLIEVFRKQRNATWLSATVGQIQEVEDALWQLNEGFDVDTAEGQALDFLGTVVGEARNGRLDGDYRAAVRARILVNQSDGTIDDMLQVLLALDPSMTAIVREFYPAAIRFDVTSTFAGASAETMARMLRQSKPAGVRLTFVPIDSDDSMIWHAAGPDPVNGWGADWAGTL